MSGRKGGLLGFELQERFQVLLPDVCADAPTGDCRKQQCAGDEHAKAFLPLHVSFLKMQDKEITNPSQALRRKNIFQQKGTAREGDCVMSF